MQHADFKDGSTLQQMPTVIALGFGTLAIGNVWKDFMTDTDKTIITVTVPTVMVLATLGFIFNRIIYAYQPNR